MPSRPRRSDRTLSPARAHPSRPRDGNGLALPVGGVEQQLRAVIAASFERRRLLGAGEYRAFKIIEDCIAASRRGYRVFAQTSLGEILASPDKQAFRSINSKRVDILIVDSGGWPVLAVEFQGGGHYQGTAAIRDAVKKEALVKAGVGYVEVFPSDPADEIRLLIRERLGWQPRSLPPQQAARAMTQPR
jgi:hypothetical protein